MADDLSLLFNIGIITGGTKRRNIKIFGASQGTAKAADVVTPSIPMELQCTKVRENYLERGEHNLPIMIINSLLQHELHVYPSSVRNSNIDSFFFQMQLYFFVYRISANSFRGNYSFLNL